MTTFAIRDNRLIEAKIVPDQCFNSPGFCPGGVYHTFCVRQGEIPALELRLEHFRDQLRKTGHGLGEVPSPLLHKQVVDTLLDREGLKAGQAKLRIMVFDAPVTCSDGKRARSIAFVQAADNAPKTGPFRCAVAREARPVSCGWGIKKLGHSEIDEALNEAKSSGFDDVLFVDDGGNLCEASYANIVAIFGDYVHLVAPTDRSYKGVALSAIDLILHKLPPLRARYGDLALKDIARADEVFLTSAVRGLQPVHEIENAGEWPENPPNSARVKIYNKLLENRLI